MHFCRFSCSLSILICLTFDVLGYLWRFGVFKKTHYQAADHQGGEAPRGPVVLARVGPQILTKHHKFCAAPSAHVFNSSASMKQNPQLAFINRKGVRHLPSGIPPAPKSQQPRKTRVWRFTEFGPRARRLVNNPFRLDSQRLLGYLTSMRVPTLAVTPANSTAFWNTACFYTALPAPLLESIFRKVI